MSFDFGAKPGGAPTTSASSTFEGLGTNLFGSKPPPTSGGPSIFGGTAFGSSTVPSASTSGSVFGNNPGAGLSTATPAANGFGFGGFGNATSTATSSTSTPFLSALGGAVSSVPSGAATIASSTTTAAAPGFRFGALSATPAAAAPGFELGSLSATPAAAPPYSASSGLQLGSTGGFGALASASAFPSASAPTVSGGFGLKPASSGLTFGAPAAASVSAPAAAPTSSMDAGRPSFGGMLGGSTPKSTAALPSSASDGGLKLTIDTNSRAPSATASTVGFKLPALSTAAAPAPTSTTSGSATLGSLLMGTAAKTTTAAAASTASAAPAATTTKMSYKELEDQINKWSVELESQEKIFLEQATKVNAWDGILIENGRKITDLNNDVENVKQDQLRLTSELDFIASQQNELEELLVPLERAASKLPSISSHQHIDSEREHTYRMAENIDAQLKRMTEDLKELIDHLNATSGPQDGNDPLIAISKILNAHMDSLQWIDNNTATLQQKTQAISLNADAMKLEHERNLRMAYN